jgi:hypothetical protein
MTEQEYEAIANDFSSDVIGEAVAGFDGAVPPAFKGLLKASEVN